MNHYKIGDVLTFTTRWGAPFHRGATNLVPNKDFRGRVFTVTGGGSWKGAIAVNGLLNGYLRYATALEAIEMALLGEKE